ncbi:hypothetical protein [Haloarcula sediminis]|uniref:hypothetical protein n=1 Tax=Haloarcula sediminis TaxID=3111777 RepID=UPI002D784669|nr:hypothetical protein [Haloarcula sp. CK38]
MMGTVSQAVTHAMAALATASDGAIAAGSRARAVSRLAEQVLVLAGSGVVLGLGLGITVSGVATYLYKRKQIRDKLDS